LGYALQRHGDICEKTHLPQQVRPFLSLPRRDVGAAAETTAGSCDHDDPHVRVAAQPHEHLEKLTPHGVVDRIQEVRPVQRYTKDTRLGHVGQDRLMFVHDGCSFPCF